MSNTDKQLLKSFLSLSKYLWVPVLTSLLGLGGAAAYVRWAPPVFVSSAAMWETEKIHLNEGALFTDDSQNYIGTQIALLGSGTLYQAAIKRLQDTGNAVPIDKEGFPLLIKLNFREAPKSAVFSITASSADPAFSQKFLDALMNEYLDYKKNMRKIVSGDTAASIATQVESLERDLKIAQDALISFQRTTNLAILQQEGTYAGAYLAKLRTDLSDLQLEDRLMKAAALDQDKANSRQAIQLKMECLQDFIKEWEIKVVNANSRMAEAEHLKQNVERAQRMYDRFVTLLQNVDISRNTDLETIAILEPASPALRTYTREKRLLAMAGFGGLGLGLGIIILMGLYRAKGGNPVEAASRLGQDAIKLSAAERLEQIKELHEKGFLSKEAYDRKVDQIVDSL
jgi:uncharacterized protein involved in exopolysaccharide biosynthesis